MKNLIVHLQSNSPELVAGDAKEFPGAFAGDWLLPRDGGRILVKGAVGYEFLVVAGDRVFVEFKQMRRGWVANHLQKPDDASWFERDDSPDGKEGLYRVGVDGTPGNRVEETIYAHELTLPGDGGPPFTATQAFRSTATSVGRELMKSRIAQVAGRRRRQSGSLQVAHDFATGAPWRLSLVQTGRHACRQVRRAQWHGPTIEQVRLGAQLRKAFKTGASWDAPLEPPAPPNPSPRSNASPTQRMPAAGRSPSPAGVRR